MEKIIKTTLLELIDENQPISFAAISKRSGISRSTLYRRFGTKENLLNTFKEELGNRKERITIRGQVFFAINQLISDRSLVTLTIEEIADQANISPITIYRNFKSKETLIREFIMDKNPQMKLNLNFPHPPQNPEQDLVQPTITLLHFLYDNQAFFRESITNADFIDYFHKNNLDLPKRTRVIISEYFSECIKYGLFPKADAGFLAQAYFGLLSSFTVFSPVFIKEQNSTPDFEETSKKILTLFLYGTIIQRKNEVSYE